MSDFLSSFYQKQENLSNTLEKRMLFMGYLTQALSEYEMKPIVVGGNALEFYTLGGYATGDIDIIFSDNKILDKILSSWGFSKEGRHWYNSDIDIAIEAPTGPMNGDLKRISEVEIDCFKVYIIGIEDLIVDRMNAFVHWKSADDGFWAKELLVIHKDLIDWDYLSDKAESNGVKKALFDLKGEIENANL